MYIAAARRKIKEKTYTYYRLVEGIRSDRGPRQRTILNLGKLEGFAPKQIKALGRLIEQRLTGQMRLLPSGADKPGLKDRADEIAELVVRRHAVQREGRQEPICLNLNDIEASAAVLLGPVYVGLEMWKRLGLDQVLSACGFSPRQRTLAAIQVIGRLVFPGSELATSGWVARTAFSDLLGEGLRYVNKDALYRTSDRMWAARERIETHLGAAEKGLFESERTMVLYDLTSTYFEGLARANPKARLGYSRDHRGDCKQLVVGMVLDEAGFPRATESFRGNTRDSRTLEAMLDQLEARSGKQEGTTVVMDRGIATKENVARLSERGYHYIVALASQSRRKWIGEINEADFQQVDEHHPDIEVHRRGKDGEVYLIVRSRSRVVKDRAIRQRFKVRMEAELEKLSDAVAAGKVGRTKGLERIGKLRQRYQRASRFFRTELCQQEGRLTLSWTLDESKLAEAQALDGVYILKTDRTDLNEKRLWALYMMLARVEDSFRFLKTSLGIRPIFHHLEHRCDGHIFISILAYHLLHTIEQMLLAAGDHRSWPTIKGVLETHRALTIELTDTGGRVHHLRVATRATAEQQQIYRMLNLSPKPLWTKRYVVETESCAEN